VVALVFLPTLREARLVELFGPNEPFDRRLVTIRPRPTTHPGTHLYEHIDRRCNIHDHEHDAIKKEEKKEKPVLHTMVNTLQFSKQSNAPVPKKSGKKRIMNTPYEPGSFRRR